jgi:hypothetical protein
VGDGPAVAWFLTPAGSKKKAVMIIAICSPLSRALESQKIQDYTAGSISSSHSSLIEDRCSFNKKPREKPPYCSRAPDLLPLSLNKKPRRGRPWLTKRM